MNRREVVKRVIGAVGATLYVPSLILSNESCAAATEPNWRPEFFSNKDAILVSELVEIFLPQTDTPGANDVGVPAFIDSIAMHVMTNQEQVSFLAGLKHLDDEARLTHHCSFLECRSAEKISVVKKLHNEAIAEHLKSGGKKNPFILTFKELALLAYFSTEVGATKVLQYEAVPGSYKSCIPVDQAGNGRRWAT